ncbi:MAG: PilN domain-containing protein [Acidaminococcus sp.]|jgi:hypothetical protein|nr:PilN domain-containing protein [Acidaminococcus sp.]MCI2099955.1 PilN domain-containing protein [Acidaminococcus sp.]MCI2114186.1 PilN domain-containing protein [Acidaminococcus sp.]
MLTLPAFLQNALHPWPKELLALDLTRQHLVLVEVRETDSPQPVLTRYAVKALPAALQDVSQEDWDGKMADFLKEIAAKQGFTVRRLVVSLPETDCIVRKFVFPSLSAKERREAAFWDLLPYVPYEPGTFVTSIARLPGEAEDAYLAAAVSKTVLAGWLEVCKRVGWKLVKLEPSVISRGKMLPQGQHSLLLQLTGAGGSLAAYDGVYPTANDWWEKRPALEEDGRRILFQEGRDKEVIRSENTKAWGMAAQRMLEFLARQDHFSVSNGYVLGGKKAADIDLAGLEEMIGIRMDSFRETGFRFAPLYAHGRIQQDEPELITACAAAKRGKVPYYLDLASAARSGKEYWKRVLPRWFFAASLLLCFAGGAFSGVMGQRLDKVKDGEKDFLAWKERRAAYFELKNKAEKRQKRLTASHKNSLHWYYVLTELGVSLPDSCYLERVEQKKGKDSPALVLYGKSRKRNDLLAFMETLRKREWIGEVSLGQISQQEDNRNPKVPDAREETADFTITVELKPGGTYEAAGNDGTLEAILQPR